MCAEIFWTDESEEHIAARAKPYEVEEVVYMRPRLRKPGREDTTLIYGQTLAGRYLLVVTAEAMNGGLYIVTAREMTATEKREFKKKAR